MVRLTKRFAAPAISKPPLRELRERARLEKMIEKMRKDIETMSSRNTAIRQEIMQLRMTHQPHVVENGVMEAVTNMHV